MTTPNDFSGPSSQAIAEFSEGRESVLRNGEPIAVVGMACRFPKANDVSEFWRLLEAGENAVSDGVPGSSEGRLGELFGTLRCRARHPAMPPLSTALTSSTRLSSASRLLRRTILTRSSASCWKRAGRRLKTPA